MGLDMYLHAATLASRVSLLGASIEKHLTDSHRQELDEDGLYVSGWGHAHDPLYDVIADTWRFRSHEGSPHYFVTRHPDGLVVKGTIFYWRKANAIHRWFVEKVQNGVDECEEHVVHPELILDLIERCEYVVHQPHEASRLLPTQAGFFFGSTDYDEWYMHDIKETAVGLKQRLLETPAGSTMYYQSSW